MVDRRVSATGTLAADEQVVLGTKVAGRIGELLVDLGSRVRRDQIVARLDPTDAQLRVDQAVAALQQARARLGLSPEGTDDRVDAEQTSLVRQARAVLDEARLTKERTDRLWKQELIAQAQLDTAIVGAGGGRGPLPGRDRGGPQPPGRAPAAALGAGAGAAAARGHRGHLADRGRGERAPGLGGRVPRRGGAGGHARQAAPPAAPARRARARGDRRCGWGSRSS